MTLWRRRLIWLATGLLAVQPLAHAQTALVNAARSGDAATLSRLLKEAGNRDVRDDQGNTLLILAAREGRTEAVAVLLDAKASLEAANTRGYTALMAASERGHQGVVEQLLNREAALGTVNKDGNTALILAILGAGEPSPFPLDVTVARQTAVAIRLIGKIPNRSILEIENAMRETALLLASRNGNTELVTLLKSKGATK